MIGTPSITTPMAKVPSFPQLSLTTNMTSYPSADKLNHLGGGQSGGGGGPFSHPAHSSIYEEDKADDDLEEGGRVVNSLSSAVSSTIVTPPPVKVKPFVYVVAHIAAISGLVFG